MRYGAFFLILSILTGAWLEAQEPGPFQPAIEVRPAIEITPAEKQNLPQPAIDSRPAAELSRLEIAALQTAMERKNFSCGFIDGRTGPRTERAVRAFQKSYDLPATGEFDPRTRRYLGDPKIETAFTTYTVTAEDLSDISAPPEKWRDRAAVSRMGYATAWEMLAEKFHVTEDFLGLLNPEVTRPVTAGTALRVPDLSGTEKLGFAARLRISLTEKFVQVLDGTGRVTAHFPCSIAKDKRKRPKGTIRVASTAPNPNYTFNPEILRDAAQAEGITEKIMIPPGPNNPVGTAWVSLNLPGYGIHGTPDPEAISRTESHGCFRLANWNANKLVQIVEAGTPVDVVE